MTIYRYQAPSLLDEVRMVTNATGGHRAYLHARSDATPAELSEIQRRLLGQGYKTVPYSEHGMATLEVRGFMKPDMFLSDLSAEGWVQGPATLTAQKADTVTGKERLKNLTLKATGLAYNFGDICYMIYSTKGFLKERNELRAKMAGDLGSDILKTLKAEAGDFHAAQLDVGAGIGYALGGIALTGFGSKDQSQNEIKTSTKKIRNFLYKEGIDVPNDSSAHEIVKKEQKTTTQRINSFLRAHPSETLNSIYAVVGILLSAASIKKVTANKVPGVSIFNRAANGHTYNDAIDIGLGAVTLTSALTGLLVKEKKRDPDEPKRGGLGGVWDWIKEKPLRATGVGFGIATFCHAVATYGKYKAGDPSIRDTVKWRAGFVAANVFAEVLLFLSSKGHGEGVKADHSVDNTVIAATAELIARQNPALQNQLVDQLAGYMASPEVIGSKAETIAAELRAQLATMQSHPWVAHRTAIPQFSAPTSTAVNKQVTGPATIVDTASIQAEKPLPLAHAHAIGA